MNAAKDLAARLQRPLAESTSTPILYVIQPGDTLSLVVQRFYDIPPGAREHAAALAAVRYFNPAITNVHHILPGQLLRLLPLPSGNELASCPLPDSFHRGATSTPLRHRLEPGDVRYAEKLATQIPKDAAQRELFWALAQLQENYNWLATPAGIGLTSFGYLVGPANTELIREVGVQHALYQRKAISKTQYDYQRKKLLKQFADNVGPLEKFLFKGKTAQEAIRISRVKGFPATHNIVTQAERLNRLTNLAKGGGVLLGSAGLYIACRDIARATNSLEKSEIVAETVTSTLVGTTIGIGIAVLFGTTPMGWATALVLSSVSATASYSSGVAARLYFDKKLRKHDLTTAMGINQLCR